MITSKNHGLHRCGLVLALGLTLTAQTQTCLPNESLPPNLIFFSQVYYITAANAAGDRLVVGKMSPQLLNFVPLPKTSNQLFCEPVGLAINFDATAYVPSPSERNGDFSPFAGLLLDPVNNMPFPGGIIPTGRLGDPYAWRIRAGSVAPVSAASFSGASLASESIVAAFGSDLATTTQSATTIPLPTILAGTNVKVRDNAGTQRDAPLFFVSPGQANFQIPQGTMPGTATVTITNEKGSVSVGVATIATTAPGLFAANANGQGVAAAVVFRVKADGGQSYEPIARFDQVQNKFIPVPIDLGPETDQVILILFGTGIRGRSSLSTVAANIGGTNSAALFAGPQGGYVGLDQVNLRLLRSLIGRGEVDIALAVDGKTTNAVKVNIK